MKTSFLLIVCICLCVGILAEDWQKATSSMGYTVQYPSDWTVGVSYQNDTAWLEKISEHSVMFNHAGAQIGIDVWRAFQDITLDQWMEMMQDVLQLDSLVMEKVTVTEENLEGVAVEFVSEKQQSYNSTITFFKHQDKVFRISYLHKDFGSSREIYEKILSAFSFVPSSFAMQALSKDRPASRVYSCGGQNDDCKCGMDNPYPCCDNGGNCTWWAWEQACCHWGIGLPSPWRHAKYWAGDLAAHGYTVTSGPRANTVACRNVGTYGHVAWVLAVSGSKVKVSEMNCCGGCAGGVREYWYEASYFSGGYISR